VATEVYRYGLRSVADGTSYRAANRKGRAGCVCGKCAGAPCCLGRGSSRWELPPAVVAQLRLGHEFRQHLVTIEHDHEDAMDAMWRTVPAVAAIASMLDAAHEETASLVARDRAEHSAGHRTATGPDTATALRSARGRERRLRQDRRNAIEAARPGKAAELTQLAAAREDAITAARRAAAAGGLYWGCADEQTEILTSAGWRHHEDLDAGDAVLTLNVGTGLSEWQPVLAVNRYEARRAPMLTMRSRGHSSVTTLNHRWPLFWTDRQGTRRQEWLTSADLPGQRAILTAAPLADPPPNRNGPTPSSSWWHGSLPGDQLSSAPGTAIREYDTGGQSRPGDPDTLGAQQAVRAASRPGRQLGCPPCWRGASMAGDPPGHA
jgi:hypothetical protein